MSTALMPRRESSSFLIASLQGSAPKSPISRLDSRRSTPCFSAISATASAYEGVAHSTRAPGVKKAVAVAVVHHVAGPRSGESHGTRHQLRPGVDVLRAVADHGGL